MQLSFKRLLGFKSPGIITVSTSRKPPNTGFRQQRLKAWQPILTPQSVLPLLVLIACIFAPIGVGLVIGTLHVQDYVINYTNCDTLANTDIFTSIPSKYVSNHFRKHLSVKPMWKLEENESGAQSCQIQFEIPNNIKDSVYVYYKLTNFFQNHRKYVDSVDWGQLRGKAILEEHLNDHCKPLRGQEGKAVYPCGLIANSMFNDTFSDTLQGNDVDDFVLTNKKISWSIDRKRYKKTTYKASEIVPPPNWIEMFPDGYTDENIPDLSAWEEFQVWMRTAAFPTFYKLALKNEKDHLAAGNYTTSIALNYPIESYGGTKSYVLTTNSIVGARNLSLGIVFLIIAGTSILVSIIFLLKIVLKPRLLGDQTIVNFGFDDDPRNSSRTSTKQVREIL